MLNVSCCWRCHHLLAASGTTTTIVSIYQKRANASIDIHENDYYFTITSPLVIKIFKHTKWDVFGSTILIVKTIEWYKINIFNTQKLKFKNTVKRKHFNRLLCCSSGWEKGVGSYSGLTNVNSYFKDTINESGQFSRTALYTWNNSSFIFFLCWPSYLFIDRNVQCFLTLKPSIPSHLNSKQGNKYWQSCSKRVYCLAWLRWAP